MIIQSKWLTAVEVTQAVNENPEQTDLKTITIRWIQPPAR